jgi:class 3 adenylate cyclase
MRRAARARRGGRSDEEDRPHEPDRRAVGKRLAAVDLAPHLGGVLCGNVGAADRLDFTVIGPAVNEVFRYLRAAGQKRAGVGRTHRRGQPGLPSRTARSVQLARCTRGTRNYCNGLE